jgi:hypothetical protein
MLKHEIEALIKDIKVPATVKLHLVPVSTIYGPGSPSGAHELRIVSDRNYFVNLEQAKANLVAVRKQLAAVAPAGSKVSKVAQHGFWNLGRFDVCGLNQVVKFP